MPEHYTLSTVEASVWCNRCGKMTQWRVAMRHRQYCLDCYNKPVAAKEEPMGPDTQGDLFNPDVGR